MLPARNLSLDKLRELLSHIFGIDLLRSSTIVVQRDYSRPRITDRTDLDVLIPVPAIAFKFRPDLMSWPMHYHTIWLSVKALLALCILRLALKFAVRSKVACHSTAPTSPIADKEETMFMTKSH